MKKEVSRKDAEMLCRMASQAFVRADAAFNQTISKVDTSRRENYVAWALREFVENRGFETTTDRAGKVTVV